MAIKARGINDLSQPVRLPLAMVAMGGLLALTLLGPAMTILADTAEGAGNTARQVGYLLVFVLAVVAMRPLRHPERLLVVPWPLVVALGWCWLSLVWAIDPGVGVRRLVLTTLVLWSVFALVRQIGYERTLLMVRGALILVLIANFATSLLFPVIGIHQLAEADGLAGDWRGMMAHKNIAGLACALTIILFAFDRRTLPYWAMGGGIAGAALFLILSNSKTSIGLIAAALVLGFGVALFNRRFAAVLRPSRPVRTGIVVALLAGLAALFHFGVQSDAMLEYISDPGNLTGRTSIWVPMVRYYFSNPMLGAGYGSFWNINAASPIKADQQGWLLVVSQGHNGFLDLMITIGLPGLILVLAATLIWPLGRLLLRPGIRFAACALIASIVIFCIGHNGTESSLFDRDTIGQVFLMLALALLVNADVPVVPTRRTPRPIDDPQSRSVRAHSDERTSRPARRYSSRGSRPS